MMEDSIPTTVPENELNAHEIPIRECRNGLNCPPKSDPSNDNETENGDQGPGGGPECSLEMLRRGIMFVSYLWQSILFAVIIGTCSLIMFNSVINAWTLENYGLYCAAIATFYALYFLVCCCGKRMNCQAAFYYIGYTVISVVGGIFIGTMPNYVPFVSQGFILLTFTTTAIITVLLTLYPFQTMWDVTFNIGIRVIIGIDLLIFCVLMAFAREIFSILEIVIACGFALVISIYGLYGTLKYVDEVAQKRFDELCGTEEV